MHSRHLSLYRPPNSVLPARTSLSNPTPFPKSNLNLPSLTRIILLSLNCLSIDLLHPGLTSTSISTLQSPCVSLPFILAKCLSHLSVSLHLSVSFTLPVSRCLSFTSSASLILSGFLYLPLCLSPFVCSLSVYLSHTVSLSYCLSLTLSVYLSASC